jgi:acetyltransferase
VGRLTKLPGTEDGEFAMLISDAVQRQGLGTEMLRRLVEVGQDWGLKRIVADILLNNGAMQKVCRKLGFEIFQGEGVGESMVKAVKVL